jgi:small subunit ribosomal protein S11
LKTRGFLKVYLELKNRFNVQRITALKEDFDEYNETITLLDEAENPVEKEAPVDKKKKESPKSKEKILAVRKNTINKKLALKENSNKAKKKKQRFRKRVNTKSNRFNHRIRSRKKIKLLIGKYRKVSTLLKKVKFKQRLQKLKDNHPLIRPYLLGLRKFASEKRSSLYINLNEALVVNEERALSKSYFEDRMRLQIRQSRNNLFVTLLSSEGTVLDTLSVGAIGYKGPRRATPFAAAQLGRSCALKYLSRTKRKLLILIMSPIKAHIKSFVSNFFTHHNKVMGILNKIPVAHNGLREKKARRL